MLKQKLFAFLIREWILVLSVLCLLISSLIFMQFPDYSVSDFEVLFILFILFVTVKGLENSGIILRFARWIEKGKFIPLKLVLAAFFLSMLITNDASLIVIVPLTLMLRVERKDILVILEALAANAGSALTPIGNPQNFFIYWYYNIPALQFMAAILMLPAVFLILLILFSFKLKVKNNRETASEKLKVNYKAAVYLFFFAILILTVIHILPVITGIIILLYALLFDRKSILVDYALIISFFCFFGFAENMKIVLAEIIKNSKHIFLFSALLSQVMSNVPATILIGKITPAWKALLWGSNVGGFGSPVGSLANLIAIKFYLSHKGSTDRAAFLRKFVILGYISFLIGGLVYFVLIRMHL